MEQGRAAAHHAFGVPLPRLPMPSPYGIFTVPEISVVGETEQQLTEAGRPYETGVARYKELARGRILGDSHGMVKLLVCPASREILGAHLFGTGATELVHTAQVLMGTGGTIDHIIDAVFNVPTLSEAYKVAALDCMNRLNRLEGARTTVAAAAEQA